MHGACCMVARVPVCHSTLTGHIAHAPQRLIRTLNGAPTALQASTFLRLARDTGGRVPAAALFRYCTMRSAQIQLVSLRASNRAVLPIALLCAVCLPACAAYGPLSRCSDPLRRCLAAAIMLVLQCDCINPWKALAPPLIWLRNPSHALPPCPQRVELGVLDTAGSGAPSPSQLLAWLERRAPLAACCEALVSETDWCAAVAARLLLLHGRRGRVLSRELLASPEVMELALALHAWDAADAAMQAAAAAAAAEADGGSGARGGAAAAAAAPQAAQLAAALSAQQGWFAPAAVAALRSRFAELDADGDGLLTQEDFST